jgi:hypothetical protein
MTSVLLSVVAMLYYFRSILWQKIIEEKFYGQFMILMSSIMGDNATDISTYMFGSN